MQLINQALDLIFPPRCVFCNTEVTGDLLCPACAAQIKPARDPWQKFPEHRDLDGVIVTCAACPELRKTIHTFKYKMYPRTAAALAAQMSATLSKVDFAKQNVILTPVPLHWSRQWWRGFNQAEKLAAQISAQQNLPLQTKNLVRATRTKSQMKLDRRSRLTNLQNAFAVKNPAALASKTVLVVDDVTTTGSTLGECATVLKKAGAAKVIGLVLSRGV